MKRLLSVLLVVFAYMVQPATTDAIHVHHFRPHVSHHRSHSHHQARNAHITHVKSHNQNGYNRHHYGYNSQQPRGYWTSHRTARVVIWLCILNNHHKSKANNIVQYDQTLTYRVYYKDGDVIDYNVNIDNQTYNKYFKTMKVGDTIKGINLMLKDADCDQIKISDVSKVQLIKKPK